MTNLPRTTPRRAAGLAALALAGAFGLGLGFAPAPASAQLGVCGIPPLPPCANQLPRRDERPARGYREDVPVGRAERVSDLCRTPDTRCRVDEPRRVGARCICIDEDGDESRGRIR